MRALTLTALITLLAGSAHARGADPWSPLRWTRQKASPGQHRASRYQNFYQEATIAKRTNGTLSITVRSTLEQPVHPPIKSFYQPSTGLLLVKTGSARFKTTIAPRLRRGANLINQLQGQVRRHYIEEGMRLMRKHSSGAR